jgi:hypothetical protein
MYAKRVGDDFYISTYKHFSQSCVEHLEAPCDDPDLRGWVDDETPPSHYFAVLSRASSGCYKLYLTCSNADLGVLDVPCKECASIKHSTAKIREAKADVRVIKVTTPGMTKIVGHGEGVDEDADEDADEDSEKEDEPDPAVFVGGGEKCYACYGDHTSATLRKKGDEFKHNLSNNNLKGKHGYNRGDKLPYRPLENVKELTYTNQIPVWNPEICSLILKFDRNRVQRPSAKNYILYPGNGGVNNTNTDNATMQFGKVGRGTYSCDYKYPYCALQAFGVALTMFKFEGGADA